MATKSVFQMEVDSTAWDKFRASFKDFQDELKKTSADSKGISGGFAGISGATANAWRDLARDSRSVASHIASATASLASWAGIIGGLVGVGSLWGLDRLANVAGNLRRSSLGLGATPGEIRGFAGAYGRVVDPSQVLGGVNAALHDVTKRVGLYGAGLTENDLRGRDTGDVASELIPALKKIADQTPESMLAQVLQARHLDQFISLEDFERLKHTPGAEFAGYQQQYQSQRKALELTQQQQKAWQDLQVQLHFAGMSIETTFIRGLAPLAPQLGRLSEAFRTVFESLLKNPDLPRWIDEAAAGLGHLADWVGSPQFAEDVQGFISKISRLATAIGGALDWVVAHLPGVTGAPPNPEHSKTFGWPSWLPKLDTTPNPAHNYDPFGMNQHSSTDPRGIRNNNPLNLSYLPGQGATGSDGRFGIYPTMGAGIDAAERQLLLYQDRDHLNTVRGIINKWAPPGENDTGAYANFVAGQLGISPDALVDLHNQGTMDRLVRAMGKQETGRDIGQYMGTYKDRSVQVVVKNTTGGNANVSVSQLAAQWT